MTFRTLWTTVLVLAAVTATACSRQSSDADQRLAELEKQLAETQQRLAESSPGAKPEAATPPAGARAAAPAPQKPPAGAPAAQSQPEAEKLVTQQQEVNAKQAETNAQLQQQVEQLKPREYTLPTGTTIPVRTSSELSTAKLKDGSSFDAILERDLKSGDVVLAPARSRVTGVVVTSDPGGRVKGTASLTIGVRSIVGAKGQVIAVSTDTYAVDAESTRRRTRCAPASRPVWARSSAASREGVRAPRSARVPALLRVSARTWPLAARQP